MTRYRPPVVLALALLAGCTTKPSQQGPAATNEKAARTDPWPGAAAILRKQPDLSGARQAISLLTSELADNPNADVPVPLTGEASKSLGERLRLSPEELKEVSGSTFTNLDAAYIAECLLIRDAVRSLDLGNLPVERKVRIVFDWVCRQIYLRQGIVHTTNGPAYCPPLPPQYSLFRGYGSGLDRAYLFLAALRQLGLDGCLIGPPNRGTAASIGLENNKPTKGPFWAVGCRLSDGTIQLFEPWRGEAFPGPGGATGTLDQAVAGSEAIQKWIEDKNRPWDVTPGDLKVATVYASIPYSAVSPRLKMLEAKIAVEVGVRLYVDPVELAARFGPQTKTWSPAADRDKFCLTRVLPSFLPLEEGGTDQSPARDLRLYDQITKLSPIPLELFSPPPEVTHNEVQNALKAFFLKRFSELLVEANPRDRIGRGQFNDVIRTMVERERQLGAARDRARLSELPENAIARWSEMANELYEKLSIARLPQNQGKLPDAQAAVEQLWEKGGPIVQLIEDRRILPICAAEVGYVLAVCKHEQAERAAIRLSRIAEKDAGRADAIAASKEAWSVAVDAWNRYFAASEAYRAAGPERAAHSRLLADRAVRLAANPLAE